MTSQLNPRDIVVAGLSALQLVQYARAQQWERTEDQGITHPQEHFGPLAAELAAIDPGLVIPLSQEPGDLTIDIANVAGLAWAAAGEAGDRVAALETRVRALEQQLAALL